ncbi:50S ribosomal protein L35ae [Candidatus Woesearchaeota archaeon]|jgi:large subunit ribosomal protein L35Ae|nr:50S ribosomal protein L35ae [Candidatus Woesearchaeota archaeon]
MEGIINNYRRSRTRQYTNHMIITVEGVLQREEAEKLVGKKVTFKTQTGKEIFGEVRSAHGNKGAIRVIFERGLPGQALGNTVQVA